MKKLASLMLGAVALNLMTMGTALADSVVTPPNPPPGGTVITPPGVDQGIGIAFTGGSITVWMVVLSAALLVAGVTLVLVGRRRLAASK